MSLTPGVRLGVYEIVALVGAGGMGEVYHARDARLARDLASHSSDLSSITLVVNWTAELKTGRK